MAESQGQSVVTQEQFDGYVKAVWSIVAQESQTVKALEEAIRQVHAGAHDAVIYLTESIKLCADNDADMQESIAAYLYWKIDILSVSSISNLFGIKNLLEVAKKYPYHGIKCDTCAAPMDINSRAALITEARYGSHTCKKCRLKATEEHNRRVTEELYRKNVRLQELRAMPYKDYLLTEEWAAIRDRKLKHAQFRCELCNKQGKLSVHHKTYDHRGQEPELDLIVLCGTCHAKFHDKLPVME